MNRNSVVVAFCLFTSAVFVVLPHVEAAEDRTWSAEVVDSSTGLPIACRVYLQNAGGEWLFVESLEEGGTAVIYDKQRTETIVEKHTTVSAGRFGANLKPGRYRLTIERGKEYLPHEAEFEIRNAQMRQTVPLKRWINMAGRGWFSGDTHVHRTVEELPNLMLAEDLNVAFPLTQWVTVSNTPPGQGKAQQTPPAARLIEVDPTHVIWPLNTEYEIFSVGSKRHTLGAVFVLDQKQPLKDGIPPVRPIAREARRQKALLDLDKHSWPWSLMIVPVMDVDLFELSNNHIWRTEFQFHEWTIDTLPKYTPIETNDRGFTERGWIDFGMATYYGLLNCGFKMRPTAGTASGVHPVPLGFGRVYVHIDGEFTYEKWVRGLDRGESFVTTGPMLEVKFNGQQAGTVFKTSDPMSVEVTGTVRSSRPLGSVEIIVNGRVQKSIQAQSAKREDEGFEFAFQEQIAVNSSSWIAVRCWEPSSPGRNRFAHTAPVHIQRQGHPLRPRKGEVQYFIKRIETEIDRNRDLLSSEELAEYREALNLYLKLLETATDD